MHRFSLSAMSDGLFSLGGPSQSLSAPLDLRQVFWAYFWSWRRIINEGLLTSAASACCYTLRESRSWRSL